MNVSITRLVGWDKVLDSARTTVGKDDLHKEPSDAFKKSIILKEHSPIRNLLYEITWTEISYWVAMHLRTHHIGFHSGEDDLFFVETQRTDRTQKDRDNLPQCAKVTLRAIMNAHSIINISRVRLCTLAAPETTLAWETMIRELRRIEPILAEACVVNCIYRGFCPEGKESCGYSKLPVYHTVLNKYETFFLEV